jgi:hypothetical protein
MDAYRRASTYAGIVGVWGRRSPHSSHSNRPTMSHRVKGCQVGRYQMALQRLAPARVRLAPARVRLAPARVMGAGFIIQAIVGQKLDVL